MKATLEIINRQFVDAGVLDADKLDAILKRHGLIEIWEQFRIEFLRDKR